nr:Ig-like domain repeat protein [Methanobrevibacter sp. TMH8]
MSIYNNIIANNTIFEGNLVYCNGGGIGGNLTIYDSIITNNTLKSSQGYAVNNTGSIHIINTTISDNDGGGILNDGNATLEGNNISGNSGDGVNTGNGGDSTIVDNEIVGNGGNGVSNEGNAIIDGNTVNDNAGDGIINNGNATVENNTVSRNSGDDIVNNGDIDGSGNIINIQSDLAINTTVSGNKVTIRVKATNSHNGNVIVGATINFYANGKLIGSAITNNNGIAEFTYNIPKTGTYNLFATLEEFNTTNTLETIFYSESNTTATINAVLEKNTIITVSAPTINEGKKTNIKVTLKDINGNILKNKKVSLKINGKTYTATTNNKGIAVFKIAGLKGGKHTLTVKFAGDNNYKSSTTKAVQKITSKTNLGILSIKKLSFKKRVSTYRVTIANTGSLKSKSTVLALFHMRKGIKIKTKYIKIKSIAPGKKISIIVSYFPDKANHRYCIAHFQVDPKNKNKEIILANNKKSISLKH